MSVTTITAAAVATLAIAYGAGQFTSRSLHTEIEIDAPAGAVWGHLTDTASYPEWNPFVKRIAGDLTEGMRIEVTVQPDGGAPMNFRPEVLKSRDNRELRWIGSLGLPGIFDGEHYFIIEEGENGKTRFRHGETFSGMLSHVLFGFLEDGTRKGFRAMNEALKTRVEADNS